MGISDAYVEVTCDFCDQYNRHPEIIQLHVTARGNWTDDDVDHELRHLGWIIEDDQYMCPSCVEDREEKDKEEESNENEDPS